MTKKECLSMTIDEIRAAYREWLTKNTNRGKKSIDTTISDALYLWNHGYKDDTFWDILFSNNFETEAKAALKDALKASKSTKTLNENVDAYFWSLKRFREFILEKDNQITYLSEAIAALKDLGGKGTQKQIGDTIEDRKKLPSLGQKNWRRVLAGTLQRNTNDHTTDDNKYPKLPDEKVIFLYRDGVWILKDYDETAATEVPDSVVEEGGNTYGEADFERDVFCEQGTFQRLRSLLLHRQNMILQGAPGVGKTYMAKRLAYAIMGKKDENKVGMIQFHQSYSYEDFVYGYKPNADGFAARAGIFYKFCERAKQAPDEKFFFIIDEINRGNMSKIFGELMMLLEKEYRGEENRMILPIDIEDPFFYVPENVYIIGMMNTADRSLAMMDYALRRRFAFVDVKPAFETYAFKEYQKQVDDKTFNDVVAQIVKLNQNISKDDALGAEFSIGHSYFCKSYEQLQELKQQDDGVKNWIKMVVEYDIIPMIKEYWFDNKSVADEEIKALRDCIEQ